jgi:hypothetical protein
MKAEGLRRAAAPDLNGFTALICGSSLERGPMGPAADRGDFDIIAVAAIVEACTKSETPTRRIEAAAATADRCRR